MKSKRKSKRAVRVSNVYVGEVTLATFDCNTGKVKTQGSYRLVVHDRRKYNALVRAWIKNGNVSVLDIEFAK